MKNIIGKIAKIETAGMVDGPGVRFVVFLQGCPLRCAYCHNPETWDKKAKTKINLSPTKLVEKIENYTPYFKNNGGVTFSGGEPLVQKEFLLEVLKLCKEKNIHTCLDTSGYGENYEEILDLVDLVILDVKSVDKEEYKKLTGGDFEKWLQFLNLCQKKKKKLWLRQVIVPGLNDDEEHIINLKNFVKNLKYVERIELLPYHTMGVEKYKNLGIKYRLENVLAMDKQRCQELEKILKTN